ncbi:12328_t:CDS:2 [Gigaspora rosea]|nr:12328_t:CDS:2 [Gigaspora rosea]
MPMSMMESTGKSIPSSNVNPSNPLLKRHEEKKCYDYLVLTATFEDSKLTGVVTLAGDDSRPVTFVYGLFSRGIEDPKKFNIFLEDCNHKVVYNLTKDLDLKFDGHGGTKPFCAYIPLDIFKFFYVDGKGGKRKRQSSSPYVSTSSPADSAPATQAMP